MKLYIENGLEESLLEIQKAGMLIYEEMVEADNKELDLQSSKDDISAPIYGAEDMAKMLNHMEDCLNKAFIVLVERIQHRVLANTTLLNTYNETTYKKICKYIDALPNVIDPNAKLLRLKCSADVTDTMLDFEDIYYKKDNEKGKIIPEWDFERMVTDMSIDGLENATNVKTIQWITDNIKPILKDTEVITPADCSCYSSKDKIKTMVWNLYNRCNRFTQLVNSYVMTSLNYSKGFITSRNMHKAYTLIMLICKKIFMHLIAYRLMLMKEYDLAFANILQMAVNKPETDIDTNKQPADILIIKPELTIEFAMYEFNRMKDTYYIDENGELVGYEIESNIPIENELITEMGKINYNINKSINEFTEYTESILSSGIIIDESVLSNISEKAKNLIKWIYKKLYNACKLMKASLMKMVNDIRDTSTKYFDFFRYGGYDCTIKWFKDGFYTEVLSPLRNSHYLKMSNKEIELCNSIVSFGMAIKRNEDIYNGWNQLLARINSSLVSMRASECIDFQNKKNALNILKYIETFINSLEDKYKKGTEAMRDVDDERSRSISVQRLILLDKSEKVEMNGKEAQDCVDQYFAYVNKVIKFHLKAINDTNKLMHQLLSLWKVNTMRCEAAWKKIEERNAISRFKNEEKKKLN